MRKRLLASIAALAAGAGLTWAQPPRPATVPPAGPPTTGAAVGSPMPLGPSQFIDPLMNPGGMSSAQAALMPAYPVQGFGEQPFDGNARPYTKIWSQFDYLLWTVRNGPSGWPLVVSGTTPAGAVQGAPGSVTLFGGSPFDFDIDSAARITAGMLLPGAKRV